MPRVVPYDTCHIDMTDSGQDYLLVCLPQQWLELHNQTVHVAIYVAICIYARHL